MQQQHPPPPQPPQPQPQPSQSQSQSSQPQSQGQRLPSLQRSVAHRSAAPVASAQHIPATVPLPAHLLAEKKMDLAERQHSHYSQNPRTSSPPRSMASAATTNAKLLQQQPPTAMHPAPSSSHHHHATTATAPHSSRRRGMTRKEAEIPDPPSGYRDPLLYELSISHHNHSLAHGSSINNSGHHNNNNTIIHASSSSRIVHDSENVGPASATQPTTRKPASHHDRPQQRANGHEDHRVNSTTAAIRQPLNGISINSNSNFNNAATAQQATFDDIFTLNDHDRDHIPLPDQAEIDRLLKSSSSRPYNAAAVREEVRKKRSASASSLKNPTAAGTAAGDLVVDETASGDLDGAVPVVAEDAQPPPQPQTSKQSEKLKEFIRKKVIEREKKERWAREEAERQERAKKERLSNLDEFRRKQRRSPAISAPSAPLPTSTTSAPVRNGTVEPSLQPAGIDAPISQPYLPPAAEISNFPAAQAPAIPPPHNVPPETRRRASSAPNLSPSYPQNSPQQQQNHQQGQQHLNYSQHYQQQQYHHYREQQPSMALAEDDIHQLQVIQHVPPVIKPPRPPPRPAISSHHHSNHTSNTSASIHSAPTAPPLPPPPPQSSALSGSNSTPASARLHAILLAAKALNTRMKIHENPRMQSHSQQAMLMYGGAGSREGHMPGAGSTVPSVFDDGDTFSDISSSTSVSSVMTDMSESAHRGRRRSKVVGAGDEPHPRIILRDSGSMILSPGRSGGSARVTSPSPRRSSLDGEIGVVSLSAYSRRKREREIARLQLKQRQQMAGEPLLGGGGGAGGIYASSSSGQSSPALQPRQQRQLMVPPRPPRSEAESSVHSQEDDAAVRIERFYRRVLSVKENEIDGYLRLNDSPATASQSAESLSSPARSASSVSPSQSPLLGPSAGYSRRRSSDRSSSQLDHGTSPYLPAFHSASSVSQRPYSTTSPQRRRSTGSLSPTAERRSVAATPPPPPPPPLQPAAATSNANGTNNLTMLDGWRAEQKKADRYSVINIFERRYVVQGDLYMLQRGANAAAEKGPVVVNDTESSPHSSTARLGPLIPDVRSAVDEKAVETVPSPVPVHVQSEALRDQKPVARVIGGENDYADESFDVPSSLLSFSAQAPLEREAAAVGVPQPPPPPPPLAGQSLAEPESVPADRASARRRKATVRVESTTSTPATSSSVPSSSPSESDYDEDSAEILRDMWERGDLRSKDILRRRLEKNGPLSPGSLSRKFIAELNMLDTVNTAFEQVLELEKSQGVAIANIQSTSIAQMFREKELQHEKDLEIARAARVREEARLKDEGRHHIRSSSSSSTSDLTASTDSVSGSDRRQRKSTEDHYDDDVFDDLSDFAPPSVGGRASRTERHQRASSTMASVVEESDVFSERSPTERRKQTSLENAGSRLVDGILRDVSLHRAAKEISVQTEELQISSVTVNATSLGSRAAGPQLIPAVEVTATSATPSSATPTPSSPVRPAKSVAESIIEEVHEVSSFAGEPISEAIDSPSAGRLSVISALPVDDSFRQSSVASRGPSRNDVYSSDFEDDEDDLLFNRRSDVSPLPLQSFPEEDDLSASIAQIEASLRRIPKVDLDRLGRKEQRIKETRSEAEKVLALTREGALKREKIRSEEVEVQRLLEEASRIAAAPVSSSPSRSAPVSGGVLRATVDPTSLVSNAVASPVPQKSVAVSKEPVVPRPAVQATTTTAPVVPPVVIDEAPSNRSRDPSVYSVSMEEILPASDIDDGSIRTELEIGAAASGSAAESVDGRNVSENIQHTNASAVSSAPPSMREDISEGVVGAIDGGDVISGRLYDDDSFEDVVSSSRPLAATEAVDAAAMMSDGDDDIEEEKCRAMLEHLNELQRVLEEKRAKAEALVAQKHAKEQLLRQKWIKEREQMIIREMEVLDNVIVTTEQELENLSIAQEVPPAVAVAVAAASPLIPRPSAREPSILLKVGSPKSASPKQLSTADIRMSPPHSSSPKPAVQSLAPAVTGVEASTSSQAPTQKVSSVQSSQSIPEELASAVSESETSSSSRRLPLSEHQPQKSQIDMSDAYEDDFEDSTDSQRPGSVIATRDDAEIPIPTKPDQDECPVPSSIADPRQIEDEIEEDFASSFGESSSEYNDESEVAAILGKPLPEVPAQSPPRSDSAAAAIQTVTQKNDESSSLSEHASSAHSVSKRLQASSESPKRMVDESVGVAKDQEVRSDRVILSPSKGPGFDVDISEIMEEIPLFLDESDAEESVLTPSRQEISKDDFEFVDKVATELFEDMFDDSFNAASTAMTSKQAHVVKEIPVSSAGTEMESVSQADKIAESIFADLLDDSFDAINKKRQDSEIQHRLNNDIIPQVPRNDDPVLADTKEGYTIGSNDLKNMKRRVRGHWPSTDPSDALPNINVDEILPAPLESDKNVVLETLPESTQQHLRDSVASTSASLSSSKATDVDDEFDSEQSSSARVSATSLSSVAERAAIASSEFANEFVSVLLDFLPPPPSSGLYNSLPVIPDTVLEEACQGLPDFIRFRYMLLFDATAEALADLFLPHEHYLKGENSVAGSSTGHRPQSGVGGRMISRGGKRPGVSRGLMCFNLPPRPLNVEEIRQYVCKSIKSWSEYSEVHGENLDALLIQEVRQDEPRWLEEGSQAKASTEGKLGVSNLPVKDNDTEDLVDKIAGEMMDDLIQDTKTTLDKILIF